MSSWNEITEAFARARDGDPDAVERLLPMVYEELHALAEGYMRQERADHTLQPTALIHEAYLRLTEQTSVEWQNREHFFAVAAQAMRRILVNHAKSRHRAKRGGGRKRVPLDDTILLSDGRPLDVLALDEALTQLTAVNAKHARLVELRFFGGLTIKETAAVLEVSTASVERDWRCARARLYHELTKGDTQADGTVPDDE